MIPVSVIIPAFRAEQFIARSISSALAQSLPAAEIVIGSDDGQDYVAVLAERGISDSRLRCVFTGDVGKGAASARNAAMRAARGRVIAALDADDEIMPHHLDRMVPMAIAHGLAISQVEYVDYRSGDRLSNLAKTFPSRPLRLDEVLLACLHTYAPIVFDREAVPVSWNGAIPLLEDAVFLAECFNALPSVWYSSEPSYRYYRRAGSACSAPDAARRFLEAARIIRQLLDNGGIAVRNPQVGIVLKAYLARNDTLEVAFERGLARGEVADFHDFMSHHLTLLHSPLV